MAKERVQNRTNCSWSSSMLHAVGNYQVTALKGFAIEELEIDLPFHLVAKGEHSLVTLRS
jgi:hypothetical protein